MQFPEIPASSRRLSNYAKCSFDSRTDDLLRKFSVFQSDDAPPGFLSTHALFSERLQSFDRDYAALEILSDSKF